MRDGATILWTDADPPSASDIEMMAVEAFYRLPDDFRTQIGSVQFAVEEFPSEAMLAEMGLDSAYDLVGVFQAIAEGNDDSDAPQSILQLFRRPLLDYWADCEEPLGELIARAVIFEIGHRFGLEEDALDDILARVLS